MTTVFISICVSFPDEFMTSGGGLSMVTLIVHAHGTKVEMTFSCVHRVNTPSDLESGCEQLTVDTFSTSFSLRVRFVSV